MSQALCERIPYDGHVDPRQSNILPQHPADQAAWIWSQDWQPDRAQVLRFSRQLTLARDEVITIHLSADQRYQFSLNGERVATGPDRCDIEHWSVATYRLSLSAGTHELSAVVCWIPMTGSYKNTEVVRAPMAQMSWRGGFILAAEGQWNEELTTGVADWKLEDLTPSVNLTQIRGYGYLDIGPSYEFDMAQWGQPEVLETAVVRIPVGKGNIHGVRWAGWQLYPTCLPEQDSSRWTGGKIRTARAEISEAVYEDGLGGELAAPFDKLFQEGQAAVIPAGQTMELIWDMENYYCGYADIAVKGGAGSVITFAWSEGLFRELGETVRYDDTDIKHAKENRNEIAGKVFLGFGDTWMLDGGEADLPALWWRSGRYVQLRIQTGDAPLTIERMGVRETRYPLEREGHFNCDDAALNHVLPTMWRGAQMCAHEIWVDCPYYEQLAYVGDNVTELAVFVQSRDGRLDRRAIELFDWSRDNDNMVAERYPSQQRQDSCTYAMLYPVLLHDYALWRDDPAFVKKCLPGLRALIEQCLTLLNEAGNVTTVPGWPFVDWVRAWDNGCGPGVREGDAAMLNLHLMLALRHTAKLESHYGDNLLAERATQIAERVAEATRQRFWNAERGLMADDCPHAHYSEHAQALSLLTGVLTGADAERCVATWLRERDQIEPATIYFSHYTFEALAMFDQGKAFADGLEFWKGLPAQGFYTMPEQPEPSRSDCHGWGSHPLYHCIASVAGIRPASFDFGSVKIAPMVGVFQTYDLSIPHPNGGMIEMDFDGKKGACRVVLPDGLEGTFEWKGKATALTAGVNELTL